MKFDKENTFFACVIGGIFIICLLAVGSFVIGSEAAYQNRLKEREATLYPAWRAAHPDSKLSFEQWNALYCTNLLPR